MVIQQPQSEPPPKPKTCIYSDPVTSRRCRMPCSPGKRLCGAHNPGSVPCPKCSTLINPHSLSRHLGHQSAPLCPVEKQQVHLRNSGYYRENVNLPHVPTSTSNVTPDFATIRLLLSRLLPAEVTASPPNPLPENDYIHAVWSNPRDHTLKMETKHFEQIAALSSLLLTPSPTTRTHIIELAAGRGYASLYLAHVLNVRRIPCAVVTVDRAGSRHKADRTLRAWVAQSDHFLASFQRLRIDLAHLHLAGVPGLADADIRIVGKHACGAALDLALTTATKFANVCKGNVRLVLASCCRNRCAYRAFGDDAVVWRDWAVSEEQVAQVCRCALWGLDENHDEERADIGRKCRMLIDHARVTWLRKVGWDAHATTYTEASPESTCIVAFWKGLPAEMSE